MAEPRDDRDDRVDLTDLDVITRYSLAVRSAKADREDLIAVLRADLDWLEQGRRASRSTTTRSAATSRRAAKTPAKAPVKKTPARRSR